MIANKNDQADTWKGEGKMEGSCIRVNELARRLSISRSAAYELANSDGFYPAFHIGKSLLVNVTALEKWLSEKTAPKEGGD